jgi:hypothetical protein
MANSELPVLGDRNLYPSDDVLSSIIGDKKIVWQKIMSFANENFKGITEEWRYYNDGKQWLFKLQYRKKTVFWVGVLKDTFRITFYFGNKAEPVILNSGLPQKIKDDFSAAKSFGTLRPVTITISGTNDLDVIYELIRLKTSLK